MCGTIILGLSKNETTIAKAEGEESGTVSTTPVASNAAVVKKASTQKEISFLLTTAPEGTYMVYADDTTELIHHSVTAELKDKTLTLTCSGDDIPVGTYYITVTESGKAESERLALTVAEAGDWNT